MALALLRLDDSDGTEVTFVADTGTNSYYRIHLGKEVRREEDIDLVDSPYWSSPWWVNPQAGHHFDTRTTVRLPAHLVTERGTLAQLETSRGPDGRGPAFSRPVRVAGARRAHEPVLTMSVPALAHPSSAPVRTAMLRRPRTVPVCSAEERFSRTASVADLIGAVSQAAAPVVLAALNRTSQSTGAATATAPDNAAGLVIPALLSELLRTVLGALGQPPPAAPKMPTALSISNRLTGNGHTRSMTFGVDDALLAAIAGSGSSSLIGPLVQALPQLLNAAIKQKLDRQAQTDRYVTDLLSEVNRTMLLQQLMAAQQQPVDPGATRSDLGAVSALLQQRATSPAPVGTPAAVARPASIGDPATGPIASRAVLSPVTGPAVTLLGTRRVVFVADQTMTLRYRLDTGVAGPARPLSRAILTLCVREPGGAVDLCRRQERLTNVAPDAELKVALTAQEYTALPVDTVLDVLASLRWKGARGTYQSTCAQQLVVASRVQVRDRGDVVGQPVELTDMTRFRSFWNKVWESPTRGAGTATLPLWGVDAALRYSVVAVGGADANGLMQTRVQQDATDGGIRAQTTGRIKSGLEVSVTELNKLLPLWVGEKPLSEPDLAAFTAPAWLAGQGGDAVTQLRMEGRRGTRGVLWVVPVLRLRAFTLATAAEVDPYGQLVATQDRVVHFPVIESVRLIGLATLREDGEPGAAADITGAQDGSGAAAHYQFDGYDVVLQTLIGLEPAQPIPKATG